METNYKTTAKLKEVHDISSLYVVYFIHSKFFLNPRRSYKLELFEFFLSIQFLQKKISFSATDLAVKFLCRNFLNVIVFFIAFHYSSVTFTRLSRKGKKCCFTF